VRNQHDISKIKWNLHLMPINRSSQQTRMTLEEFYSQNEVGKDYSLIGEQMLAFLKVINETFTETKLWGLTSHYRLVIQKEDKPDADWLIIVSTLAGQFYFEYLIPKTKAPWENAFVTGTAKSLEEAKKFLLIAMIECEGWKDNSELKRLSTN
jgi:hypothetical protein